MKLRKVLAAVLSAAMVVTSVVIPQGAASALEGDQTGATADITSGLIAYYGFEDSLENGVSKTGGTAKLHGGAGGTWNEPTKGEEAYAAGKKGKAYSFTGDVDGARGEGLELDVKSPEAFTVSFWANPDTVTSATSMVFIPIDLEAGLNVADNWFGKTFPTVRVWGTKDQTGAIVAEAYLDNFIASADALCGQWTHISVTCDAAGNLALYINGQSKGTGKAAAGALKDLSMFLGINFWDVTFDGLMDEVYVYNRALSATDVAELYSIGQNPPAAETLSIKEESKALAPKETYQLSTSYTPPYAAAPAITWTSSDNAVATVDDNGVVTGVADGSATITAAIANGKSDTCEITVKEVSAISVTPTADTTDLLLGETVNITYTYEPEDVTNIEEKKADVTYESSDAKVLTVDKKGMVKAVGIGKAKVTVNFDNVSGEIEFEVDGYSDSEGEFIKGPWYTAWTKGYELKDDSIRKFKIKVRGGSEVWNNVAAVFANCETDGENAPNADNYEGYSQYVVIRGDDWALGDDESKVKFEEGIPKSINIAEVMKRADIDVTIQRDGDKIIYTMDVVNGDLSYKRVATYTHVEKEPVYVSFASDTSSVLVVKGDYLVKTAAKEATCTEDGNKEYWTCDGKNYVDAEMSQEIENVKIEALGHEMKKTEAKDATCTENGNKEYWICSRCKKNFADEDGDVEIKDLTEVEIAAGHKTTKVEAKAATCTENGNKEYYTCAGCDKIFEDEAATKETTAVEIEALGHDMEKTEAKAATCTENGNEEYWTCSRCTKNFVDEEGTAEITEIEIPALGHKLTHHKAANPDCGTGTDGTKEYWDCSVCNKKFSVGENPTDEDILTDEDIIEPAVHAIVDVAMVLAGCTEDGHKAHYKCTKCETLFLDQAGKNKTDMTSLAIPAAHKWVYDKDQTTATCTTAGKVVAECSVCRETKNEEGEALGHNFDMENGEVTPPTCTEEGYTTYKCTRCTETKAEDILKALGHDMEKTVAKEATCTEKGNSEYYTCKVCHKNFADADGEEEIEDLTTVEIAAKGHTITEVAAKEATCTEKGNEKYYTCSDCHKNFADADGEEEIEDLTTVEIAAKGHTITEVAAKAATCTEKGNEKYYTCSDCHKNFADEAGTMEITDLTTVEIPAGHKTTKVAAKAATCTAKGNIEYYTCSGCDKKFADAEGTTEITGSVEIEALGHSYNEGEVTKAATCTEAGVLTKTCTVCGDTKTEEIPAKGHSLTKVDAKEATTTETGNIEYYTCSECGKYFSDAEGTTEITLESTIIDKKTDTSGGTQTPGGDTKVSITLNTASVTLYTGKVSSSAVIKATVAGTSDAVTWTTSNVNVVKVMNGTITAVGKGTATITVAVKGASKTVQVTVKDPSITVKKGKKAVSKVKVKRKKKAKLTVSVTPSNSGLSLVKLSKKDKKKVKATLKKGKLTIKGKKKGKVTLKIKSGNAVKKIKVTVK